MAVQGILSKDLIPKVHDVWSNQRASEDKVLQNTSCMATFQRAESHAPADIAAHSTASLQSGQPG